MGCTSTMNCTLGDSVADRMETSTGLKVLRLEKGPVIAEQPLQQDTNEQSREKQRKKQQSMSALVDYSSSSCSEDDSASNSKLDAIVTTDGKHNDLVTTSIDPTVTVYTPSSTDSGPQDSECTRSNDPDSMSDMSPDTLSSSQESLLGRVMSCLIRLLISLERLGSSGLLPLHSSGSELVAALESVEELYETQCIL